MKRSPKYCRQKIKGNSDLAYMSLDGVRHYPGKYDTSESREPCHRLLAEWQPSGCRQATPPELVTIVELIASYWAYAQQCYAYEGGQASSYDTSAERATSSVGMLSLGVD